MKKIGLFIAALLCFDGVFAQSTSNEKQQVKTVQPKIMVVPYTKEGDDIRKILENDINRRVAVTKVKEAFDNRDFTTVDFVGRLKAALDDQMITATSQTDIKSQLMELSGADIYVEVEVPEMISTSGGNSARLILTGYDVSTGNSLANKVCESPKNFTTDYGALVSRALNDCAEGFLNTLQTKFSDIVENGRSIKINFVLAQGSKYKFSSEITSGGLPFSDVLEDWMAENSYKNNYHIQGITEVRMLFDDVRIPLKDEKGRNNTQTKFASKINQFIKSKGVTSKSTTQNGTLFITIQ